MASLNTLRTKFGIVLSIVIAGALLAFILSLKTEMGLIHGFSAPPDTICPAIRWNAAARAARYRLRSLVA